MTKEAWMFHNCEVLLQQLLKQHVHRRKEITFGFLGDRNELS